MVTGVTELGTRNSELGTLRAPRSALRAPNSGLHDTTDFAQCFGAFRPRPPARMLKWSIAHAVTERGRPYDHAAYPHNGAPGGPMDAYDHPRVRELALQMATRLGKTFFCQLVFEYTADVDPAPAMLCSTSEKLAREISQRTYKMIRQTPRLKDQLLKSFRLQRTDLIEFLEMQIFIAWARSTSTLADKDVKVGVANEVDQWEHSSTSREGDPAKLFSDRFKDHWATRKIIWDSVPRLKSKSRIEPKRLAGTNCSYHVPCPHCRRYQALEFGDGTAHGVVWEKPNGQFNAEIARRTAVYKCCHCEKSIDNYHRSWIMRRGVWCPLGARVNAAAALEITEASIAAGEPTWEFTGWKDAEWVTGTPANDGPIASYQLSSLYALALTWGDTAAEFVQSVKKTHLLRNWKNQWMAETWSHQQEQQTWQELAVRLQSDVEHATVPGILSLVTIGVDKQADHYVYAALAWGPARQAHVLDYGTCEDLDELTAVITTKWQHADGGRPLKSRLALIDCGFRSAEVYQYVRDARKKRIPVHPCRGSGKALNAFYIKSKLSDKSSAPGMTVVRIDSSATQDWLDCRLHQLAPGEEGAMTLFRSPPQAHQDFLEQVMNDAANIEFDRHNNLIETWDRADEEIPNDYRDCVRYALVAMLAVTRSAPIRPRKPEVGSRKSEQDTPNSELRTPNSNRPRLHHGPRPRLTPR